MSQRYSRNLTSSRFLLSVLRTAPLVSLLRTRRRTWKRKGKGKKRRQEKKQRYRYEAPEKSLFGFVQFSAPMGDSRRVLRNQPEIKSPVARGSVQNRENQNKKKKTNRRQPTKQKRRVPKRKVFFSIGDPLHLVSQIGRAHV